MISYSDDKFELLTDSELFVNVKNIDNMLENSIIDLRFPENILLESELSEKIDFLLSTLETKEREIIKMRFGFNDGIEHTLKETGSKFNISRQRVGQIINKSICKLLENSNTSNLLFNLI